MSRREMLKALNADLVEAVKAVEEAEKHVQDAEAEVTEILHEIAAVKQHGDDE